MNASSTTTDTADETRTTDSAADARPAAPAAVVNTGTVDARVVDVTPEAAEALREHIDDASGGGSRFGWFVIGFVSAVVAGAIGAVAFLALSDSDDDGRVEIDVPAVDVSVDG